MYVYYLLNRISSWIQYEWSTVYGIWNILVNGQLVLLYFRNWIRGSIHGPVYHHLFEIQLLADMFEAAIFKSTQEGK